jgi:hypothetical protein
LNKLIRLEEDGNENEKKEQKRIENEMKMELE